MSRDLQCLDSTPINSPELRSLPQQPSDSCLNRALTENNGSEAPSF